MPFFNFPIINKCTYLLENEGHGFRSFSFKNFIPQDQDIIVKNPPLKNQGRLCPLGKGDSCALAWWVIKSLAIPQPDYMA